MASGHSFRTHVAVGLAAALAACSGGLPGSPSGTSLEMPNGRYVLTLAVADLSGSGSGPVVPSCPGLTAAGISDIALELTGRMGEGAFDASAATAMSGTVHLHLQPGLVMNTSTGLGSVPVTGWVEGHGTHQNQPGLPAASTASQVQFDGRATLRGDVAASGFAGYGTITGTVVVSNADGVEVKCNPGTVGWSLTRTPTVY